MLLSLLLLLFSDGAVVNDDDDNDAYKAKKGCQRKGIPLLSSEFRLAVACSGVTADDLAAAADLVAYSNSSNEEEEPCCPNTVPTGYLNAAAAAV